MCVCVFVCFKTGWSSSSDRPRQLYRTVNPHPPGNSVTAAVLGAAIKETELVTSVEKGLSLITIHYTLLCIIYYQYLLTLLCMVFTVCAACTATSHDKRLYIYISTLGTAQYWMAVFCSSLMQSIPPMLLRYFLSDFDNGSNYPSCYWYHFCIDIPHKLHIIIIIRELF